MDDGQLQTVEQAMQFLEGSEGVEFRGSSVDGKYKWIESVLIRFTKSRPRHTNDNGLVESKNGSVLRKQLGYAYIPQRCAELINEFSSPP